MDETVFVIRGERAGEGDMRDDQHRSQIKSFLEIPA